MSSKRQTTFAKMERERKVRERRALKQEKKQAAAAARSAQAADEAVPAGEPDDVAAVEDR
jgi:hypothetical protein